MHELSLVRIALILTLDRPTGLSMCIIMTFQSNSSAEDEIFLSLVAQSHIAYLGFVHTFNSKKGEAYHFR
jgi:hypothetical protein